MSSQGHESYSPTLTQDHAHVLTAILVEHGFLLQFSVLLWECVVLKALVSENWLSYNMGGKRKGRKVQRGGQQHGRKAKQGKLKVTTIQL